MQDLIENKDYVLYEGYMVCRNGDILSKKTRKRINAFNLTHEASHVKLSVNGKKIVKNKAALVYTCFSGEPIDTYNYVIQFKNGDNSDTAYDNLFLKSKKDYYNERGLKGQKRFDSDEVTKIKEEYEEKTKTSEASIRSFAIKYNCAYITMKRILDTEQAQSIS